MTRTLVPLLLLAALVAACAGGGAAASSAPPSAAMSMAPSEPASAAPSGGSATNTAPPGATTVHVLDFRIEPAALTVKGSTVMLFVINDGPTVHNVTIRDQAGKVLMATPDLREGESAVLSGTLQPGTYVTFCSLPGHESLGTKGTLTVTG